MTVTSTPSYDTPEPRLSGLLVDSGFPLEYQHLISEIGRGTGCFIMVDLNTYTNT